MTIGRSCGRSSRRSGSDPAADVDGARDVPGVVLVRLADVDDQRPVGSCRRERGGQAVTACRRVGRLGRATRRRPRREPTAQVTDDRLVADPEGLALQLVEVRDIVDDEDERSIVVDDPARTTSRTTARRGIDSDPGMMRGGVRRPAPGRPRPAHRRRRRAPGHPPRRRARPGSRPPRSRGPPWLIGRIRAK